MAQASLGLIGYGRIGEYVAGRVDETADAEVGFVHTASDPVDDLGAAASAVDLVLEAADFRAVRELGATVLEHTDLVVLSGSALADGALADDLAATCQDSGTTLYVPHGAVLGMDGLRDARESLDEVRIETRKNPDNLDFGHTDEYAPEDIDGETLLYEGPTRGLCSEFPRNVNSHATVALAGVGFGETTSTLVADPSTDAATHHITATGDGTTLEIRRRSAITGVTGAYTLVSVWGTLRRLLRGERGVAVV